MSDVVDVGPFKIIGADSQTVDLLQARDKFYKEYCQKKGWSTNPGDLSLNQVMEIRSQEDWKNPPGVSKDGVSSPGLMFFDPTKR
jgi:hypothetical protein